MKLIFLSAFALLAHTSAFAMTTTCTLDRGSNSLSVKSISWNDSTLVATSTDFLDQKHTGKVTLVRAHDPGTEKVNILIKYSPAIHGKDASEYIVFPVAKNNFRVIGVGYMLKDGNYYLDLLEGNFSATCASVQP